MPDSSKLFAIKRQSMLSVVEPADIPLALVVPIPLATAVRVPPLSEVVETLKLFLSDAFPDAEFATLVVRVKGAPST